MSHFIDRRLNPKGKSLGNRQRFLRRAREQIKDAVTKSLKGRSVKELDKSGKISIPAKSTSEPRLRIDSKSGSKERVHPGNKEFTEGDRLRKPPASKGGGGKDASTSGDGEDNFSFILSKDEFLDIFFDDLELPNLVKTTLKESTAWQYRRSGMTSVGSPTNINLIRTMRNAQGRRLALKRPSNAEVTELREQLFALESLSLIHI